MKMRNSWTLHELGKVLNSKSNVRSSVGKEIQLPNQLSVFCGIRIRVSFIMSQLRGDIKRSSDPRRVVTLEFLEEVQSELPLSKN